MRTTYTKRISSLVGAALAATVLIVGATYWFESRHAGKAPPAPQALPADVHQQLSGYTFTRSDGGRQIFTVHAARTVAFKGGTQTRLEDVSVDVFGRAGDRHDVLRTASCEYDSARGGFRCAGKVEVELNAAASSDSKASNSPAPGAPIERWQRGQQPPVYLETSNVSFQQQGGTLVSDAPVRFRYGPASGSGIGLEYAAQDRWFDLRRKVVLDVPSSGGGPPWRLTASGLRYTQENGQVELRGPVEITEGSRHATADRGWMLIDRRNRVKQAGLEGNVYGTEAEAGETLHFSAREIFAEIDPSSEQLRTLGATGNVAIESEHEGEHGSRGRLLADRVQLNFSGAHPSPQDGTATGDVELSLQSPGTPRAHPASARGGQTPPSPAFGRPQRGILTASELQFEFGSEGLNLHEAATVGAGKLVLVPMDSQVGARVVTGGQFVMSFDAGGRLERVRGLKPARIVFEPGPGSPATRGPVESSSDLLEAKLDPATQSVRSVDQSGNVHLDGQDRQATAERAQYSASTQILTLTGDPLIWNPDTEVRADRFLVHLGNNTAEALGNVSSTHFDRLPRSATATGSLTPGAEGSAGGQRAEGATHVLAERMVVNRQSEFVHYEGRVRAWHGDDVVESSSLDIDGLQRRVRSGAGVITSDLQMPSTRPRRARAADAPETARPVTIRADRLEYFDLGRQASYQGHVRMQAESAILNADHLDVFFSSGTVASGTVAAGAKIERALAEGHVVVTEPQGRATADRAEYFAEPGKVVLTGGPPAIYDADKGFATGQRLTLFLHDDTLIVDGGAQSPALSKYRIAQ